VVAEKQQNNIALTSLDHRAPCTLCYAVTTTTTQTCTQNIGGHGTIKSCAKARPSTPLPWIIFGCLVSTLLQSWAQAPWPFIRVWPVLPADVPDERKWNFIRQVFRSYRL